MKQLKNITRFTYEFTSFQGWRVSICRQNQHFTRYFSDKKYGNSEAALQAAIDNRDQLLRMLYSNPHHQFEVFQYCRSNDLKNATPLSLHSVNQLEFA